MITDGNMLQHKYCSRPNVSDIWVMDECIGKAMFNIFICGI